MPQPFAREDLQGTTSLRLWSGWVLGPAGWALHETGSYAIVPLVCDSGRIWPLHALFAATLCLALAGGLISWHLLRRLKASDDLPERLAQRSRFLALVGLGLGVGSVIGILGESLAAWTLDPCVGS